MEQAVAQIRWKALLPDGGACEVGVAVGMPAKRDDGFFACPVAISGLLPALPAIKGVDSLHALSLALDFIRLSLQFQLAQGVRFEDVDTGQPVDPMMWFPYLGPVDAGAPTNEENSEWS